LVLIDLTGGLRKSWGGVPDPRPPPPSDQLRPWIWNNQSAWERIAN